MADPDLPQIYLISPPEIDLGAFPDQLSAVLDAAPVACLRLALASTDVDHVARAADAARSVAHERDIAVVIADHVQLVDRLGLDGVHLGDGARAVRKTRTDLGPDAIVGAFCGTSRHDGLSAGESGADYVSFGPVSATGLGDGSVAEHEIFAWWSEMIEVPIVAEGGLTADIIERMRPVTDFFGFGPEVWSAPDPVAELRGIAARLGY